MSRQTYRFASSLWSLSTALVGATLEKAAVPSGRLADKPGAAYFGRMQHPAFPLPHQIGL
jgi:hypothetical protein